MFLLILFSFEKLLLILLEVFLVCSSICVSFFPFWREQQYFTLLYKLSLMFWWLFGEAWLSPVRELTIPVWSGCRPCLLKFLVIANHEWHYGRGLWLWVGIYLHRCWSCLMWSAQRCWFSSMIYRPEWPVVLNFWYMFCSCDRWPSELHPPNFWCFEIGNELMFWKWKWIEFFWMLMRAVA